MILTTGAERPLHIETGFSATPRGHCVRRIAISPRAKKPALHYIWRMFKAFKARYGVLIATQKPLGTLASIKRTHLPT